MRPEDGNPAPAPPPAPPPRESRSRDPRSRARGKGTPVLIRDAIDGYVLGLEAKRASPSTIRLYGIMLRRVAAFAAAQGRFRVDELTLDVARGAVADAMGRQATRARGANWKGGEATAYAIVCALRAFSIAARSDGVPLPDLARMQLPRVPERIQPRLTADEFRALEAAVLRRLMTGYALRFVVARDLALLSFLADTGLRASECCNLNVEDLDLEEGVVTVHRGKGDKPRMLSIRDDDPHEREGGPTMRALRDYLGYMAQTFGRSRRQRALWVTRTGARITTSGLRRVLATLCEAAGIDGNRPPHAFRRGYFSAEYRDRPTSLPVLKQRMGWSPKSHHMVEVYTRGAEIDLARDQPQPLVSKRWRNPQSRAEESPDRGPREARRASLIRIGAGLERAELDPTAAPRRVGKEADRQAGQPARGRRLSE